MPSTKEIRRRIKSIKNTSQITKAMQMVAATKMRRAQNQALSSRPYSQTMNFVLSKIADKINGDGKNGQKAHLSAHPLLLSNNSSKVGIVLLSTDKGLCGALNSNLFRLIGSFGEDFKGKEITYYTIGKKGRDFVVRSGKSLEGDFEGHEHINFSDALKIRKFLLSMFLNQEIGEAYLLYPHFVSTLRQEAKLLKLLPIDSSVILNVSEGSLANASSDKSRLNRGHSTESVLRDSSSVSRRTQNDNSEFLFEPNADQVLEYALTHIIDTQIYQALLETKASEHSARMVAMKSATDNAKDLVQDLSLAYNQMRQAGVTNELLEITSAAAALE